MIDVVVVSVLLFTAQALNESKCVWQFNGGDASTCRPRARHICKAWDELKHKVSNDPYTNVYYTDLYCQATCLARNNQSDCSIDSSCVWFGSSDTAGFCRGVTATEKYKWRIVEEGKRSLNDPSVENLFITRHAQFSYSINEFDCYEICRKAGLGASANGCERMHWCCHAFELQDNKHVCSADTVKIAKRVSPQMLSIASMERECRVSKTEQECIAGERSDL